jgi:hypothetical protein
LRQLIAGRAGGCDFSDPLELSVETIVANIDPSDEAGTGDRDVKEEIDISEAMIFRPKSS